MVDVIEEIEEVVEKEEKEVKKIAKKVESAVEDVIEKIEGKEKSKKSSKKKLEKEAEKESTDPKTEKEIIEAKRKALLERVKEISKKVEKTETEFLKEEVKKSVKKTEMLIPLEEYVKSGIYLGTRVVTPAMSKFIYRRRADGLAIFDTNVIDEKLKEGIDFLSKFKPEDIILCCKRQAGWKVALKFSELTGIRVFTKKYPAGILTNTNLKDFFENELTIIFDSWLDKNALNDTLNVKKKVLMISDTNNFAKGADKIIIGNNKSPKSLGLIFYLLTRGYMKAKKMDTSKIPDLEWWIGDDDNSTRAQYGV